MLNLPAGDSRQAGVPPETLTPSFKPHGSSKTLPPWLLGPAPLRPSLQSLKLGACLLMLAVIAAVKSLLISMAAFQVAM
jgi:hypothetical protein